MAFNAFLIMDGSSDGSIPPIGVPQDQTYKNAIPVLTYDFATENPTTIGSGTGGAGAGKAKFDSFVITKTVDSASPTLFAATTKGLHFTSATLVLLKGNVSSGAPYLVYKFGLVFISKIESSGDTTTPQPLETVTFAYGALQITYTPQANGTIGTPITQTWNQITNSPVFDTPGIS